MSPRINYFCSRKKSKVSLNKKAVYVFNTIFKLDFITQIKFYCIIHRCLCFHFILFLFSYISLKQMEHINNVNLSLFIQLAKVNNNHRMDEKRSQKNQNRDPEYVTGQNNSRILQLLLSPFCCLILALSRKS